MKTTETEAFWTTTTPALTKRLWRPVRKNNISIVLSLCPLLLCLSVALSVSLSSSPLWTTLDCHSHLMYE